jgi:hypothetical protein
VSRATPRTEPRWLLLVHQIPPKPSYFRAKVGRRLQKLGAVAIKNSVYVVPFNEQTQEDMQWATREIIAEGGDATLCTASLVEGLRDEQVEALFQAAREADYAQIADEARAVLAQVPAKPDDAQRAAAEGQLARLGKRLAEVGAIDFFGAPGRESAQSLLAVLARRARAERAKAAPAGPSSKRAEYQRRTWVTRKNVHVDRIASAWLVRRFIDDRPTFKFVEAKGYAPKPSEVTFDMFEATFTHVGDRCTFEVLLERFGLRESGLRAIAEIVHDIDVKDGKFARPEAPGVASLVAGIAVAHRDDEERLAVGGTMLDALLELFRRKSKR